MWGKSRNVTHNYPTRLGALRAVLSYSKHSGVSWVWLAIVILVKIKCTFGVLMLRFWAIWGDLGLYEWTTTAPQIAATAIPCTVASMAAASRRATAIHAGVTMAGLAQNAVLRLTRAPAPMQAASRCM